MQFTVSRDTHDKLRQVQDLLRHSVSDGDPAAIFDRALTLLLMELRKTKLGLSDRRRPARAPQRATRHVSAAVRREVWARDGGQCTFVGADPHRCTERGLLEFHHVVPFAVGGPTTTQNLQLRCRRHNAHEASEYFGDPVESFVREDMAWYTATANSVRTELQPNGVIALDNNAV